MKKRTLQYILAIGFALMGFAPLIWGINKGHELEIIERTSQIQKYGVYNKHLIVRQDLYSKNIEANIVSGIGTIIIVIATIILIEMLVNDLMKDKK